MFGTQPYKGLSKRFSGVGEGQRIKQDGKIAPLSLLVEMS